MGYRLRLHSEIRDWLTGLRGTEPELARLAMRMNIRQERVAAIERAEPGATEVRTLAAYVRVLGGRLEIIASIGDERIALG